MVSCFCKFGDIYTCRLDIESEDLRDLETRGPWAVASERSQDATKGPRVSKLRRSDWMRCLTNLEYSNRN